MTDTAPPQTLPDHRADLAAAQDWVATLIAGVRSDQWAAPTPCSEFDVSSLVKHLFGVADRVIVMGAGAAAESTPASVDDLPEDPAADYQERVQRGRAAWSDAASLARPVTAPWGTMPGAFVVAVYVGEVLAHGWDLAVATGQDAEADPTVAAVGLQSMHRALPAEGREGFPFGPAVPSAPDAGPTEQLANWLGRTR